MAEYKLPRLSDQDAVMAGLMKPSTPDTELTGLQYASERAPSLHELFRDYLGRLAGDTMSSHDQASKVADFANVATLGIPYTMYEGYKDYQQGQEDDDAWMRAQGAAQMGIPFMPGLGSSPAVAKGVLGGGMAGLGGAVAYDMLGPTEANAAKRQRLTRRQRREMEMKRQESEIQAQQEKERREHEMKMEALRQQNMLQAEKERRAQELEAARIQREQELADRLARQKQEAALEAQLEKEALEREANKPFREKFQTTNALLPFLSVAGPLAAGALVKSGATAAKNAVTRGWDDAIDATDTARKNMTDVKTADPSDYAARLSELASRNKAYEKGGILKPLKALAPDAAAAVGGATIGVESGLFPTQWNAAMLPSSAPEGEEARARIQDPDFYKEQLGRAVIGGLSGMTGSKMSGAVHRAKPAPIHRSKGLVDSAPDITKKDIKERYQSVMEQLKGLKKGGTNAADKKKIKELEAKKEELSRSMNALLMHAKTAGRN